MNALQMAVYGLVEQFVQRQSIPFEVIRKYRPHLVDSSKRRSTDRAYLSSTASGFWGEANEWEYRLHGGGCHVIQVETREVIGWDAPNLRRFDPYWLVDWIRWYMKQFPQSQPTLTLLPLVDTSEEDCRHRIFAILDELHRLHKLHYHPDSTNKYELVS